MTPELTRACEIVFQEHKNSAVPIPWNKDIFRGRISMGLLELTKDILLKSNVIIFPNKTKKITTVLNPVAIDAINFQEAIEMAKTPRKQSSFVIADQPAEISYKPVPIDSPTSRQNRPAHYIYRAQRNFTQPETFSLELKWYHRPLYSYFILPVFAAAAGVGIAWLLGQLALLF